MKKHAICFAAAVCCFLPAVNSQTQTQADRDRRAAETGLPFIKWFSPQEYGGQQQVFSFAQDNRGILYAGHGGGLLEYDGTSWRPIATPHNAVVRSMARGVDGRIFVGENGDFGYLAPDKSGEMKFTSLLEYVPREDREFQDVANVHATPEGVYFQVRERLFLLTPDGPRWRTRVWKAVTSFARSFLVFGTVYVEVIGAGLHRIHDGKLVPLPLSGIAESPETAIRAMLPYSAPGQILIITRDGKFHLLDEQGLRPFAVADGRWQKLRTDSSAMLGDGAIGIGKTGGGFQLLERDGNTRYYLDRAAGIPSDGVLSVFCDRSGTVWLGLQNGIAKVEGATALSEFGRPAGISTVVSDVIRYQGTLHVATFTGLKHFDLKSREFRVVEGTENKYIFALRVHGDALLAAAGSAGLFQITGNKAQAAIPGKNGYYGMVPSRHDPNRIWLGTRLGLGAIRKGPTGQWIDEGIVVTAPEVRTVVEPEPGLLWLGTMSKGVVRVRLQGGGQEPEVKRFGKADGLPGDGGVSVHQAAGRVIFASPKGVREFDAATESFIASKQFGAITTGGSAEEYTVATDKHGNIWVNFGFKPVFLARRNDGAYVTDETRMRRMSEGAPKWLFVDDDDVVWVGAGDRLYRYDPEKDDKSTPGFTALVRRVTAGQLEKKLVYGGAGPALGQPIPFDGNALRFEYAAASFEDPTANQFQTKLEGFDKAWSDWTFETRRDYTNLPPGKFRFVVRARNLLLQDSTEADFRLQILPPWYRAWWAYGLYLLTFAGGVFAVDRVMRRRLIARERARSEATALQSELERKRNVELLSEIGKKITASLDVDTIFGKLYENVNELMDAAIFGVGIYHPAEHTIEYRLAFANGKRYKPYRRDTLNKDQFPVWCIENRKAVFLNDVEAGFSQYIQKYEESAHKLEDGSAPQSPQSLIYLPLMARDQVLGIITVQSFKKNAYSGYQLNLLENLAAYTSIALDNADAYLHLKSAQEQLVVQEKLASLGALTAGIAHEIKNPLNFVNNFADLSVDLMAELSEGLEKQKKVIPVDDYTEIAALIGDLCGNAKKISEHGKRADGIVRSMLLHSRGQTGERQLCDINSMLDEYVNLAYHGMRAQDSSFNVTIERAYGGDVGKIEVIAQDLSRVFLNLLNNACYAANDKIKKAGPSFAPVLSVRTVNLGDAVEVRIRDNGMGIPPELRDKIFNPFFTTKPTGQGTGLGLSISHDIVVHGHGGQLEVETKPGEFTEFVVRLPRNSRKAT